MDERSMPPTTKAKDARSGSLAGATPTNVEERAVPPALKQVGATLGHRPQTDETRSRVTEHEHAGEKQCAPTP